MEEWSHQISETDIPHGRTTADGEINKVKFRLRFFDILGNPAISVLPLSGSTSEATEFVIDYPYEENSWLSWQGSGVVLTGTTVFNSANPMLLKTSAGQFHFGDGVFSGNNGQVFDEKGGIVYSSDPLEEPR